MALSQEFPGAAVVGERAETALRVPVGVASPLWALFGAAASVGVAYWWMTRWTRAVNVEAMAGFAPKFTAFKAAAPVTPIEIISEPELAPIEPATVEPLAAVEVAAPVEAAALVEAPAPVEVATAVHAPAPAEAPVAVEAAVEPAAPTLADDLTVMTGIGPKLAAALAERGVTRFAQIAAWTGEDLAEVDVALSLKGRAVREAWVAQAKRLASTH